MALSDDPWIRSRLYALGGVTVGVPVMTGRRRRATGDMCSPRPAGDRPGGLPSGDGVAFGGIDYSIAGREPDVETAQAAGPIMYLWRREMADSGGPGAHRGGISLQAVSCHGGRPRGARAPCAGGVVPTRGNRGGYLGGTTWVEVFLDALEEGFEPLPDPEGLEIEPEPVRAKCASYDLGLRDAARQLMTAGSGWAIRCCVRSRTSCATSTPAASRARPPWPRSGALANGAGADLGPPRRSVAAAPERLGRQPLPIRDPTPRAAVEPSDGKLAAVLRHRAR